LNWKIVLVGKVAEAGETIGALMLEFSVFTHDIVSALPPSKMRTSANIPSTAPEVDMVMAVVAETVILLILLAAAATVTAPPETLGELTI
jgi:hypothetical protein